MSHRTFLIFYQQQFSQLKRQGNPGNTSRLLDNLWTLVVQEMLVMTRHTVTLDILPYFVETLTTMLQSV